MSALPFRATNAPLPLPLKRPFHGLSRGVTQTPTGGVTQTSYRGVTQTDFEALKQSQK